MPDEPEYMKVPEIAALLRLPEETVSRMLRDGKLPGIFTGTRERWRVKRSDVLNWTTNQPKESTMSYRELIELQNEAIRRLALNTQWWDVGGVQDGYFNLIGVGEGLPR